MVGFVFRCITATVCWAAGAAAAGAVAGYVTKSCIGTGDKEDSLAPEEKGKASTKVNEKA